MVTAIVGGSWGDEGKGKITDWMAGESDVVVRYQGGSNAGHTILNSQGRFVLHLLPSGVFHKHIINIIGPGVALNVDNLMKELDSLKQKHVYPKLLISDRVQLVMPWHTLLDRLEEERLSAGSFGSTRSGIAPFYADKYAKTGLQVCDLYEPELLKEKIHAMVEVKNVLLEHLYHSTSLDAPEIYRQYSGYGEALKPYLADTSEFLRSALKTNQNILLEGQLGALKDPDHGIYPMTTSSSPLAGFASVGAGISPCSIQRIVAVLKAYSSCVGAGEFVTELFGQDAEILRQRGGDKGEYGATTGRPRRVGWFDGVANRYGCMIQGATEAALTNLDVLGYLDKIPVCTGYEIDGKITRSFPVTPLLKRAKPVFTFLDGWKSDIRGLRDYEALPREAKDYVAFIEDMIEVPIRIISTSPIREDIILR